MLSSINSVFGSAKSYINGKNEESKNDFNWKPLMYVSAVGISTISVIYAARQYYRARAHDNIPTMAPNDFKYFGGHLPTLIELSGNYFDWMYNDIKNKDWPPVVSMSVPGPQNYIFIQDPKLIKYTLDTHFWDTPKGQDFIQEYEPLLGHGIFSSNGERWKFVCNN